MASTLTGIEIPDGFKLYTENTSLLISSDEAFLNPVQEFNRDLSVACIRVWSEEMNSAKEARWRKAQEKKAKHDPISNQKGSNIDIYFSSMTIKSN
jgi:tRNA (guanine26-N2/guanine27-N2)-dimethyltransferase